MTDELSPDPDERLGAVDRLVGRLARVRSLPGLDPSYLLPALASPASTILDEGSVAVPSAEIHSTPARIYVTVELPGVPEDAVDMRAWDDRLTVRAPRPGGRTYDLDLRLPGQVDPHSARFTFRNGVLDITFLRKPRPDGARGKPDER